VKRPGLIPTAALLALSGSGCAAAGSASGATSPPTAPPGHVTSAIACGPASARTIAADAVARVYDAQGAAVTCARGSTHHLRLGMDSGTCIRANRVTMVRLAGRVVGYASMSCGVDTGSTVVLVRRLAAGRRLVNRAATTQQGVEGHATVGSLVVRASGAVAWIATEQAFGPPKFLRQVARVDGERRFAVLDSGAGVQPASLRLAGATLTWRDSAGTRQAALR
jgi:hypothetical protein